MMEYSFGNFDGFSQVIEPTGSIDPMQAAKSIISGIDSLIIVLNLPHSRINPNYDTIQVNAITDMMLSNDPSTPQSKINEKFLKNFFFLILYPAENSIGGRQTQQIKVWFSFEYLLYTSFSRKYINAPAIIPIIIATVDSSIKFHLQQLMADEMSMQRRSVPITAMNESTMGSGYQKKSFTDIINQLVELKWFKHQRMFNMQSIVRMFIRPTRHNYQLSQLGTFLFKGSSSFSLQKKTYYRNDAFLKNKHNKSFHLSFYHDSTKKPTILFLHCNSGSRVQGLTYLKPFLVNQFHLCVIDMTGSGRSDGQFISLGYYEADDVYQSIKFLHKNEYVSQILLWGRSMGAVTCLVFLNRYEQMGKQIRGVVLDSPFSSLKKLAKQVGNRKSLVPQIILKGLLKFIRDQIMIKADYDIYKLQIKQMLNNITAPAYFITSLNDHFISCKHSENIYTHYKGPKQIVYITANHHQKRNYQTIDKAILFLKSYISRPTVRLGKKIKFKENMKSEKVGIQIVRDIEIKSKKIDLCSLLNNKGSLTQRIFEQSSKGQLLKMNSSSNKMGIESIKIFPFSDKDKLKINNTKSSLGFKSINSKVITKQEGQKQLKKRVFAIKKKEQYL